MTSSSASAHDKRLGATTREPDIRDNNFLARIADAMPGLVGYWDDNLCCRFANKAYTEWFGKEPGGLLGCYLDEVLSERAFALYEPYIRGALQGEKQRYESELTRAMGKDVNAVVQLSPDRDENGRVCGFFALLTDVTRMKQTEAQLRESEFRYRMLADNSSDMVFLVQSDGRRIYASQACRKILGWTPEEMLLLTTKDVVHPDEIELLYARLAEYRAEPITLSYRMRHKDGRFIWVEAKSQQFSIESDAAVRLLVVRDIEQRVAAEQRLSESEAAYRLLADNSSDMVFQLDRNLVPRYVSPASRDILGYQPLELIGRELGETCHPDDIEKVASIHRSLLAGDIERQSVVNRRRHRDGRYIWVEARLKALRDASSGAVCGIIGAERDITQRKITEEQLNEANRRLEILAARDGLTGLSNRRAFDETLSRAYLSALSDLQSLALIMIDVDRFKSYNDRYGHQAGDDCLKRVAIEITGAIQRPADLAARYGGEEFIALLPNTDEAGAAEVAERIRLAVRALGIKHESGLGGIVTISAGVAARGDKLQGGSPDILLRNADRALYKAKHGGRDQVVNASWLLVIRQERSPRRA